MNAFPDDILQAREARAETITALRRIGESVVCLRANVPGPDKEIPEAFLTIGFFLPLLPPNASEPLVFLQGADGPAVLATYKGLSPSELKKRMIQAEDTHPLGRFVDADVFGSEGPSLSRDSQRPCWLCGAPVWECTRRKRHSLGEILACLQTGVRTYLETQVDALIAAALQDELTLDPKFGLVTPTDSGSHPDMDYGLMKRAGEAIRPHLVRMVTEGIRYPDPESLFPRLKSLGWEAEIAMRRATGGINAYKGLIFSLGLLLGALGSLIGRGGRYAELPDTLRALTAQIRWDAQPSASTFGSQAWREHGFGGIRREAAAGFPALFRAAAKLETIDSPSLTMALVGLIGDLEDSVLLKRAGSWERYREAKERIAAIRFYDPVLIRDTTQWAKSLHLSFGGAADLLACAAFLSRFSRIFAFGPRWDQSFAL
ncbi:MAG TPA: triphosphoribosyl-dephospho-CoA synthase [Candidatus Izemoplasmatales bacterium]|nr:triphosphoribosyl-dephospho-CoA synthase [Candidatus Izemoplasmatales bacterium]